MKVSNIWATPSAVMSSILHCRITISSTLQEDSVPVEDSLKDSIAVESGVSFNSFTTISIPIAGTSILIGFDNAVLRYIIKGDSRRATDS